MAITTKILTNQSEMNSYIDQIWNLLVIAYKEVEGGLHYASKEEILQDTVRWRIALDGEKVIACTLFKPKKGLKLVAMATSTKFGYAAKEALREIINMDLPYTWMELSEGAERFVLGKCDGSKYLFHASHAKQLLEKDILMGDFDGFHYKRNILGFMKSKVIVGTPMMQ